MKKFRVIIEEMAVYEIEITAGSEEEACEEAEARFLGDGGLSIGAPWSCDVRAREVYTEEDDQ